MLNGEEISSGHKIPEEGEYTLTLTDLTNAESTIHFSTYITDVDKTFSKNTVSNPSEEVALTQCGSDATAWFVPEGEEISDAAQLAESDTMTKSAEINPASILAPKSVGTLCAVSGKGRRCQRTVRGCPDRILQRDSGHRRHAGQIQRGLHRGCRRGKRFLNGPMG